MSKKENLNIISKLIKKINFLGNNQSLRDSIKDVIDEKSNQESQNIDLSSKEKSILSNIKSRVAFTARINLIEREKGQSPGS